MTSTGALTQLVQALIWPVFLAVLLLVSRKQVARIVKSIAARIESGEPFQAGPGVFQLGYSERKMTRTSEDKDLPIDAKEDGSNARYRDTIYLVHHATGFRVDRDGVERREIQIIVDADNETFLQNVERVVYHLHPSFPHPDREVKDSKNRFELRIRAWGEFNLTADVFVKGAKKPLRLNRYLNFPWPG